MPSILAAAHRGILCIFGSMLMAACPYCHPWRPRSPALPHDSPRRTSAFEGAPSFRVLCERVGISNPRTQLETRLRFVTGHDFSHADESRPMPPPRRAPRKICFGGIFDLEALLSGVNLQFAGHLVCSGDLCDFAFNSFFLLL